MINFTQLPSYHLTNDIIEFIFNNDLKSSLKRFLVEMKVQVDRWDLVTDNFIFHNNMESFVKKFLLDDIWYKDRYKLWGANLCFTDQIARDSVFAVSSIYPEGNIENRNIAMGILPCDKIKKYYDLKAFW